jgi:hypothetical protein
LMLTYSKMFEFSTTIKQQLYTFYIVGPRAHDSDHEASLLVFFCIPCYPTPTDIDPLFKLLCLYVFRSNVKCHTHCTTYSFIDVQHACFHCLFCCQYTAALRLWSEFYCQILHDKLHHLSSCPLNLNYRLITLAFVLHISSCQGGA